MRIFKIYAKDVPNRHKKDNLYPVGHLSLLSPDYSWNLWDFWQSEQSVINAFLICLESHDWGVVKQFGFPRGDISHPLTPGVELSGAKVVNYFELSKKKCFWGCFFWCRMYGVECKGGDLLGGVPPSTKPVVGIKHVHEWAQSTQLLVNYL